MKNDVDTEQTFSTKRRNKTEKTNKELSDSGLGAGEISASPLASRILECSNGKSASILFCLDSMQNAFIPTITQYLHLVTCLNRDGVVPRWWNQYPFSIFREFKARDLVILEH
ncbi:hypothetical protein QQP08_026906 [Theobroma cacao]|nr:hypothetical protein QQP08_026906 [Theobroma cacao]